MPGKIFISYSHKDKPIVHELVRSLDTEFVVWWDEDLITGQDYKSAIFSHLNEIDALVVVVSANSLSSKWVNKEIAAAKSANIPIIPIRIDTSPLPESLAHLHATNIFRPTGEIDTSNIAKLARDIRVTRETRKTASPSAVRELLVTTGTIKKKPVTARGTTKPQGDGGGFSVILGIGFWIFFIIISLNYCSQNKMAAEREDSLERERIFDEYGRVYPQIAKERNDGLDLALQKDSRAAGSGLLKCSEYEAVVEYALWRQNIKFFASDKRNSGRRIDNFRSYANILQGYTIHSLKSGGCLEDGILGASPNQA